MSGGRIQIGPGTLYTLLGRFEEQQIIRETEGMVSVGFLALVFGAR